MRNLLRETIREMLRQELPTRVLSVGGYPVTVEMASTPEEQSLGLMHRADLDPDCGMLFRYDKPQSLSFWMRDTQIPLSIAFIGPDRRIQEIRDLEPFNESQVVSSSPCLWALEVNRGWFNDRKIMVGCRVENLS